MKKANLLLFVGIIIISTFSGCTSINKMTTKDFEQGKYILGVSIHLLDRSQPIEEHAYIINLSRNDTLLMDIDGGKAADWSYNFLPQAHITILPARKHSFSLQWRKITSRSSTSFGETYTISHATTDIKADLLPGHYYFLTSPIINGDRVNFIFDDLGNYSEIMVYDKMMMPVETIIKGIDAAMKKRGTAPGHLKVPLF